MIVMTAAATVAAPLFRDARNNHNLKLPKFLYLKVNIDDIESKTPNLLHKINEYKRGSNTRN